MLPARESRPAQRQGPVDAPQGPRPARSRAEGPASAQLQGRPQGRPDRARGARSSSPRPGTRPSAGSATRAFPPTRSRWSTTRPNGTITKAEYQDRALPGRPAARAGQQRSRGRRAPVHAGQGRGDLRPAAPALDRGRGRRSRDHGLRQRHRGQAPGHIKSQFNDNQKQFQAFLKQSHFSDADALERVRLQILSTRVQAQILPKKPPKVTAGRDRGTSTTPTSPSSSSPRRATSGSSSTRTRPRSSRRRRRSRPTTQRGQLEEGRARSTRPTRRRRARRPAQGGRQGQSEPALDSASSRRPTHQIVGPFKGQSRLLRDRGRGDAPGDDAAARRRRRSTIQAADPGPRSSSRSRRTSRPTS